MVPHVKFEFHSNRGIRIGTHTYIASDLTPTDFDLRHGWTILALWRTKSLGGGSQKSSQPVKCFPDFFVNILRYHFETWYIYLVGSATHRVKSFITIGLLWPRLQAKMGHVFFFIYGLNKYTELSDLVHTYIASVLNCTDFCHGWAIFGPLVAISTQKGDPSRAPCHRNIFWAFYSTCFDIWTWNLVYTSGTWYDTQF